jgi:hypothetical protein
VDGFPAYRFAFRVNFDKVEVLCGRGNISLAYALENITPPLKQQPTGDSHEGEEEETLYAENRQRYVRGKN